MDTSIVKKIEIDKNHIENFPLETEEGTKRAKEKYHIAQVEQRNSYVQKEIEIFECHKKNVEEEMQKRLKLRMPNDKSDYFSVKEKEVSTLLNNVKFNSNISNSFKLNLDFILAKINEETSLEELNDLILDFINKFREFGINLTIDDFKYSMFTEEYMMAFLEDDSNKSKEVFDNIYYSCPDLKMHIKMNLLDIINKYDKELSSYVEKLKSTEEFSELINKYSLERANLDEEVMRDEYTNLNSFLNKDLIIANYLDDNQTLIKTYNDLCIGGDYNSLSIEDKDKFNVEINSLFGVLNELSTYYKFLPIITNLLERYKDKATIKGTYSSKKKEYDKENSIREKLYKNYLKANGIGFLAKKKPLKIKNIKLKMNEQVRKLITLRDELLDLEITSKICELDETASIYDFFYRGLSSFEYLEKMFSDKELFSDSLEDNIDAYFKYLYSPNNYFIRKTNAFSEDDIATVIADKYKLLGIAVNSEEISSETISEKIKNIEFVKKVQSIDNSEISREFIDNMCKMNEIVKSLEVNNEQ
ncbi:MAG: hypothetical protein IJI22_03625 [Bacilli bacterium]|nr:hypothetical protein [Bacilli bacterium]